MRWYITNKNNIPSNMDHYKKFLDFDLVIFPQISETIDTHIHMDTWCLLCNILIFIHI